MNEFIQILTYVIGGLGFAAGAVGYFGKKRGDSIIEYQAKAIDSLKDYAEARDRDVAERDATILRLTAERDTARQEANMWKQNAQGVPQLVELAKDVGEVKAMLKQYVRQDPSK